MILGNNTTSVPLIAIVLYSAFSITSAFSPATLPPSLSRSHGGSPLRDTLPDNAVVVATTEVKDVDSATAVLAAWDASYNSEKNPTSNSTSDEQDAYRRQLQSSVKLLNEAARNEREADSTMGRVMLGICAADAGQGLGTLKTWVTSLALPRGLLHGMDKDGVPLQPDGAVYIKYNSGGVYTFADIRKSGLGFDALWKPGDALLELYDGTVRGVYFQVELSDGMLRQYLVPLDLLDAE